jgi:hypothetical protein
MISDYGPGAFVIVCTPGGNLEKRAISIDTLPGSAGGPDGFLRIESMLSGFAFSFPLTRRGMLSGQPECGDSAPGQDLGAARIPTVARSFTTFSAFSLDTALMIERGAAVMAGVYALTSVIASVAGLFLDLLLIRQLA